MNPPFIGFWGGKFTYMGWDIVHHFWGDHDLQLSNSFCAMGQAQSPAQGLVCFIIPVKTSFLDFFFGDEALVKSEWTWVSTNRDVPHPPTTCLFLFLPSWLPPYKAHLTVLTWPPLTHPQQSNGPRPRNRRHSIRNYRIRQLGSARGVILGWAACVEISTRVHRLNRSPCLGLSLYTNPHFVQPLICLFYSSLSYTCISRLLDHGYVFLFYSLFQVFISLFGMIFWFWFFFCWIYSREDQDRN